MMYLKTVYYFLPALKFYSPYFNLNIQIVILALGTDDLACLAPHTMLYFLEQEGDYKYD